jgi:hypothetical protein
LISVNSGFNRPEYFSHWRAEAGLPPLDACEYSLPGSKLSKLLFFYGFSANDVDNADLQKLCSTTLVKWATVENQVVVFLCSDKAAKLIEDSNKVNAFFKHKAT